MLTRLLFALVIVGWLASPAAAQRPDAVLTLLSETVTTAVTGSATTARVVPVSASVVALQINFTYGSGGTSAKYYVQTSLDGGTTWVDIACFALTTSTARRVSVVHLATAVTANTTPSDGALTDNTILNGVIGDRFRVKRTTVGTYAGGTTVVITAVVKN